MKYSIVIPTKNEGKYIRPTVAQFAPFFEKFDIEVVVSDAGSRDETADVMAELQAEFGEHRVKFVQSFEKQNIAIGRNLGAKHASGEILFHTDADVRIPNLEQFFTKVSKAMERPGVVASTVPIWVYPEERGLSDHLYHMLMNGVIRLSFFAGVYLAKGECQIVHRSVFEGINGYDESIVAGEDCNLFFRLHKEGKIAYLGSLCVHHSPRRFREYGYLRLTLIYLREGLSLLFLRRSYSKEWTPVR